MSRIKVKSFVFELLGGKMCLTVMTLDNSKHCHLEQILIFLELSRYQGHYDIEHRETSKELFLVYSETRSKKKLDLSKYTTDFITDWTLANIQ